jgi:hypothetical protein
MTKLPLTNSPKIDEFLSSYIEGTAQSLNAGMDINVFKSIAFPQGMPSITVDLLSYLSGQDCAKVCKLLYQRVPPEIIQLKRFKSTTASMVQKVEFMMSKLLEKKGVRKLVPPLKDVPE